MNTPTGFIDIADDLLLEVERVNARIKGQRDNFRDRAVADTMRELGMSEQAILEHFGYNPTTYQARPARLESRRRAHRQHQIQQF